MITADFRAILERLAGNQVDFIVIGGLAASLHGSAYVTQDLDICYDRSGTGIVLPELEALLEMSKKS